MHEVEFDYGGPTRQRIGYGSIATPGGFAGLALAAERYALLPWSELLQPAIAWVERGFPLTGGAADRLAELVPAGMAAQIDLTITDEPPLAQAIVIISAVPLGSA